MLFNPFLHNTSALTEVFCDALKAHMASPARHPHRAGMKRRLFNLAAAMSLVVTVAVLALWVRARYVCDDVSMARGRSYAMFVTWRSYVGIDVGRFSRLPSATDGIEPFHWDATPSQVTRTPLWFLPRAHQRVFPSSEFDARRWDVRIPFWLLFAIACSSSWLALRTRSRIRPAGCCRRCGYDLRATPDRCPECGTPVAPKPAEAAAYCDL